MRARVSLLRQASGECALQWERRRREAERTVYIVTMAESRNNETKRNCPLLGNSFINKHF
jgi:hypothetical protein